VAPGWPPSDQSANGKPSKDYSPLQVRFCANTRPIARFLKPSADGFSLIVTRLQLQKIDSDQGQSRTRFEWTRDQSQWAFSLSAVARRSRALKPLNRGSPKIGRRRTGAFAAFVYRECQPIEQNTNGGQVT